MTHDAHKTKILLTGGGTGGSVTPLLALAEHLGSDRYEYRWVGTHRGPEKGMINRFGIPFLPIAAGKLHRFFTLRTLLAPLLVLVGFLHALQILITFWPRWIVTAGSFVSVPVVWAGWLLRRNIIVHQQDVRAGLANKLMAPFATVVTTTFKSSKRDYGSKARVIGNPVRREVTTGSKERARKHFTLSTQLPTLLILGGGTGARFINQFIADTLSQLTAACQVVHVTGPAHRTPKNLPPSSNHYYRTEFLTSRELADAYAVADVVLSRCGMGTLTELSALGKPTVLIPMPNSHQEDNARIFTAQHAALVLSQGDAPGVILASITKLLTDTAQQHELGNNIARVIKRDALTELQKIIET